MRLDSLSSTLSFSSHGRGESLEPEGGLLLASVQHFAMSQPLQEAPRGSSHSLRPQKNSPILFTRDRRAPGQLSWQHALF